MNEIERISHTLMIVMGILMYVFGSIGNILNIYVFFQWSRSNKILKGKGYCQEKCNSSLYLFVSSLSNLIIIIYPLLTRIIFDGFQYSITQKSVFILCKFRYYILHTFDLISLTCICMAIFDRYLISSRKVYLRHLSTVKKRTEQIIFLIIILFSLHSIPIGLYFNVSKQGHCIINSINYLYYYLWIYQIIFHSIIPIIFLTIFGILTYRHLKIIQQKKRIGILSSEKQLSRMLILISIAIVLSSIPYCIEHIYYVMISNNYHLKESSSSFIFLYHVICSILFYTNSVTSFYIFYISTPNFRKQVKKILFWKIPIRYLHHESFSLTTYSHNSHE